MKAEQLDRLTRVSRTLLPYAFFLLISFLCSLLVGWPLVQPVLVSIEIFVSFFLFYSTARLSTIGDHRFVARFFGREGGPPRRGGESLRYLLADKSTRRELPTILVLSFFLPFDFGIFSVGRLLFREISPYLLRRLLIFAITLPFLLFSYFWGRLTAMIYFRTLPANERTSNPVFVRHMIRYFGFAALYFASAYTIPYVLATFGVFLTFFVVFPPLVLIVAVLWFLLFGRAFLRVCRARRRLLRSLRRICKTHGYILREPVRFYRSILFPREGITFSVTVREGETYDCNVYSAVNKWRDLFFGADGYVLATPATRRGPAALFTPVHSVRTPYAFESEHRKAVIVTPAVKHWYFREGRSTEVHPGAYGWGYKFYNAEVFLGLLDRDALDTDYRHT